MVSISYFHGNNKRHTYFEGWYFKHHGSEATLSCIPGMNVDAQGNHQAFLQVLTDEGVYILSYPYEQFHASETKLEVVVGENYFSSEGVSLNIETEELRLSGEIAYSGFTPLSNDIMGPFRLVPFMQCNHGVESLYHGLTGRITCNGKQSDFSGGQGYCEKDWGASFPKTYLWTQANDFMQDGRRAHSCVMASVAHIPFGLLSFQGVICSVLHRGVQYRLATYNGAKVLQYGRDALVIAQGPYRLEIIPDERTEQKAKLLLRAPNLGDMSRFIHETLTCTVRYRFSKGDKEIFDMTSDSAGFEYVEAEKAIDDNPS